MVAVVAAIVAVFALGSTAYGQGAKPPVGVQKQTHEEKDAQMIAGFMSQRDEMLAYLGDLRLAVEVFKKKSTDKEIQEKCAAVIADVTSLETAAGKLSDAITKFQATPKDKAAHDAFHAAHDAAWAARQKVSATLEELNALIQSKQPKAPAPPAKSAPATRA
jgi:Trp operon repressor